LSQDIYIARVFNAPPEQVYQAFTDPDRLVQWFGPDDCTVARESIAIDPRVGGHLRFTMTGPGVDSSVEIVFTEVVENQLLAGDMEATAVPGEKAPLRMRLRFEFHDEGGGRTRLELSQGPFTTAWLGTGARGGWESSFAKLDALHRRRNHSTDSTNGDAR
jgi:uncharacterized protein YndB with AHSA1/START domain